MMDEREKETIQKNYSNLVEMLETQKVLPYLHQEGVLSQHDKEIIHARITSQEKAEKLLDILKNRKYGLKMLIKALFESKVQGFLATDLLKVVPWNKKEMEIFQLELAGKIDPQQMMEANLAALKQEKNQLEEKIERLSLKIYDQEMLEEDLSALKQENNQLEEKIGEMSDDFAAKLKGKEEEIRLLTQEVKNLKKTKKRKKLEEKDDKSTPARKVAMCRPLRSFINVMAKKSSTWKPDHESIPQETGYYTKKDLKENHKLDHVSSCRHAGTESNHQQD